jgi:putative nucleic acid binding protein
LIVTTCSAALILLLVGGLYVAKTSAPIAVRPFFVTPPEPAKPQPVFDGSARMLIGEYFTGPPGEAHRKYLHRPIAVTGVIVAIDPRRRVIELHGGIYYHGEQLAVECHFVREADRAVELLDVRETVTVVGTCQGRSGSFSILVTDCRFR